MTQKITENEEEIIFENQPQSTYIKKKRKINWGLLYIIATIIAVVAFGVYNREFTNVFKILFSLTPVYLVLAVVILFVYLIFESELIRMLLKSQSIHLSPLKCFKIGILGIYYSYITPSATGGQPVQSAYLLRDNIPAGTSTAVLIVKFFCFQCAFVICSAVSFIYMYPKLIAENKEIIPFIILGLIINGGSVIFFPCLFIKPVMLFLCNILKWFVKKLSFIKNKEAKFIAIDKFREDFGNYTNDFKEKKNRIILGILLSIPQFILQMSIIYFVFLAFGYNKISIFEVIAVQSLLQVSVSFMPMPGASGAQEFGFSQYFRTYFTNQDLYTAVMVWRFLTYYIIILSGMLLVIVDQIIYKKKHPNM